MSSRALCVQTMVVTALLASTPPMAEAQTAASEPDPLPRGVRVRVTVEDEKSVQTYVGRLAGSDTGSLALDRGDSTPRVIPQEAVVRLERSIRSGRKIRGALIGYGIGFATLFTWSELASNDGCFSGGGECGLHVTASALFALPAAVVGAIVSPGEEWADIPLERLPGRATSSRGAGLRLRLAPVTDGRGAGVVIAGSF